MSTENTKPPEKIDLPLWEAVKQTLGQILIARKFHDRGKEKDITTDDPITEHPLTEDDWYVLHLYRRIQSIVKTIRQFDITVRLLGLAPEEHFTKAIDIAYPDYLQYHIETHFLRLTMVFDQMVDLVKRVYAIGKPTDKVFFIACAKTSN